MQAANTLWVWYSLLRQLKLALNIVISTKIRFFCLWYNTICTKIYACFFCLFFKSIYQIFLNLRYIPFFILIPVYTYFFYFFLKKYICILETKSKKRKEFFYGKFTKIQQIPIGAYVKTLQ